MSDRFITYVIIGVAFGFTQLWFAYWVVKLYKEKQRILKARKAGGPATPSGQTAQPVGGSAARTEESGQPALRQPSRRRRPVDRPRRTSRRAALNPQPIAFTPGTGIANPHDFRRSSMIPSDSPLHP